MHPLLLSCIKNDDDDEEELKVSSPSRNHVIKTCVSTIWLLSKTKLLLSHPVVEKIPVSMDLRRCEERSAREDFQTSPKLDIILD